MSQQNPLAGFPPNIQVALFHFWQFAQWHGKKNCRRHGVGALRKYLGEGSGPTYPENVIPILRAGMSDHAKYFQALPETKERNAATQEWRKALACVCDGCGRCRWSRRAA